MGKTSFSHSLLHRDSCYDCFKKEQCLASKIASNTQERFFSLVFSNSKYQIENYIYRQGDDSEKIFFIKAGSVKRLVTSEEGSEQIIGFYFPGEMLGFDRLDTNKYASSVVALENSIVCSFPRELIDSFCATDSAFQKEFIAQYSRKIIQDYQLLTLINKKTAEQKVAVFLLELLVGENLSGGKVIHLELVMSRADIANYLGLVPETVSRVLSKFERVGMLIVRKKKLKVIDGKLLQNYSNDHFVQELL